MEKLSKIHWNAVKRIFKYLNEITKCNIHFSTEQINHIKTLSHANYVGDIETKKSTTSFVLKLDDSAILEVNK